MRAVVVARCNAMALRALGLRAWPARCMASYSYLPVIF
jgi:hypothetical protein